MSEIPRQREPTEIEVRIDELFAYSDLCIHALLRNITEKENGA